MTSWPTKTRPMSSVEDRFARELTFSVDAIPIVISLWHSIIIDLPFSKKINQLSSHVWCREIVNQSRLRWQTKSSISEWAFAVGWNRGILKINENTRCSLTLDSMHGDDEKKRNWKIDKLQKAGFGRCWMELSLQRASMCALFSGIDDKFGLIAHIRSV